MDIDQISVAAYELMRKGNCSNITSRMRWKCLVSNQWIGQRPPFLKKRLSQLNSYLLCFSELDSQFLVDGHQYLRIFFFILLKYPFCLDSHCGMTINLSETSRNPSTLTCPKVEAERPAFYACNFSHSVLQLCYHDWLKQISLKIQKM